MMCPGRQTEAAELAEEKRGVERNSTPAPRAASTLSTGQHASPFGALLSQACCSLCTHLLLWEDLRGEVVFWALEAVKARAAFP